MDPSKARIFVSYSHGGKGHVYKAALVRAMHVFEHHNLLDVWQDGKIRVSATWNDDIKMAMSSAHLAVFLLTPEALDSKFILEVELPFLRERWQCEGIPVFPVICEPCQWGDQEQSKWLLDIQCPAGAQPLSSFAQALADRHLRDLATAIARELSGVTLSKLLPNRPAATGAPTDVYLDKIPLTRAPGLRDDKLIGREQELTILDLAYAQPHTAIVSLVGWGGVGKTMLVQHWLRHLQNNDWFGARRVYGWSFYSQGVKQDRLASEDAFLAHALEWFRVDHDSALSPWDKGRLLADTVARERALLILDGIEPLQYPPGPMGGQLRAPGVHSLLKQLARKADFERPTLPDSQTAFMGGLCLVTTREPLTDLANFERRDESPWGNVVQLDLANLTEEAGAALLHHTGANRAGATEIGPDDKELCAASRDVDGHALTLHLLGRFIARAYGGDIRRRAFVKFEEADRKEQGGTTFKMLAAFEDWMAREGDIEARSLAVLRLLGLFDGPADADCLNVLRKPPVIRGLTEHLFTLDQSLGLLQATERPLSDKAWNDATYFLAHFGLITIHFEAGNDECLLDCHPLIREYFANLRGPLMEASRLGHQRLFDNFIKLSTDNPQSLAELNAAYEAIRHGCKIGRSSDCFRLEEKALDQCYLQFGANSSLLSAISLFFESPWDKTLTTLGPTEQIQIRSSAAFCLGDLGRLEESAGLHRAALDQTMMLIKTPVDRNSLGELSFEAAVQATSLCNDNVKLGRLQQALGVLDSVEHVLQFTFGRGSGRLVRWIGYRAHVLHQMGKLNEALDEFRKAETIQSPPRDWYPPDFSTRSAAFGFATPCWTR